MRNAILALAAATLAIPTAPALARPHHRGHYRQAESHHYYRTNNGVRYWRGNDGRYYCHRSNGTTGLLIGGVAGALVGRAVDGGRDHTTGTIIGAAAGALLGRHIERSNSTPRCR